MTRFDVCRRCRLQRMLRLEKARHCSAHVESAQISVQKSAIQGLRIIPSEATQVKLRCLATIVDCGAFFLSHTLRVHLCHPALRHQNLKKALCRKPRQNSVYFDKFLGAPMRSRHWSNAQHSSLWAPSRRSLHDAPMSAVRTKRSFGTVSQMATLPFLVIVDKANFRPSDLTYHSTSVYSTID